MTLETFAFDSAEYLTDGDAQLELLTDAMATGNPEVVSAALGLIARAVDVSRAAGGAGVKQEAFDSALLESGDPRLSTLLGVLEALGLTLVPKRAA